MDNLNNSMAGRMAERFRGFLPVIVDVETGGFDAERDALLEVAAVILRMTPEGYLQPMPAVSAHVHPFPGANIDPRALEITGIDPDNPLRGALDERIALDHVFKPIRDAMRDMDCQRAVLVGHNAAFDLGFLNAAVRRVGHKRNPLPLQLLRHRHAERTCLWPDGAEQGGPGRRHSLRYARGAFRHL